MSVQLHDAINRRAWQDWNAVIRRMIDEDVDALARGLSLADTLPGWIGGSVAAVIWVFQELERRSFPGLLALAEWIIEHDRNLYALFGTMKHREERLESLRIQER